MFEKYKGAIDNIVKGIGLLSAVFAAITSFQHDFKLGEPKFWIALGLLVITFAYIAVDYYLKKSRKRIEPPVLLDANQLRGVQCFEEGQILPGRDRELKSFQTIAESRGFRFGYVSGEPGSGKTSFLRAGVIAAMKQKKWSVIYIADLAELKLSPEALTDPAPRLITYPGLFDAPELTDRLLIIDQFEEFLISYTAQRIREKMARELSELIEQYHYKVVLGLRKDFVEDLRSLAPVIKNPKADENSIYIQNWELEEARPIFQKMCAADGCQFSTLLIEAIISDLGQSGNVKPIELQIVCAHCIKYKIYDMGAYRAVGKAQGILKNFIRNVVDDIQTNNAELEKIAGKYILRNLCSDLYNTKRSDGGLSPAELFDVIKTPLAARPVFDPIQFEDIYPALISKFLEAKVITITPEHKYNLSHDYLVRSIKEVTADVKTLDEQLLGLLQENISKCASGLSAHLSVRQFFTLRKRLTPTDYTDVVIRKYMKAEQNRLLKLAAISIIVGLGLLTILLPPMVTYNAEEISVGTYQFNSPTGNENWYQKGDSLFRAYINYRIKSGGADTLIWDGYKTDQPYEKPRSFKQELSKDLFWVERELLYKITRSPATLSVYTIGNPMSSPSNLIRLPEWADLSGNMRQFYRGPVGSYELYRNFKNNTLLYTDQQGFAIYSADLAKEIAEVKYPTLSDQEKLSRRPFFLKLKESLILGLETENGYRCLYRIGQSNIVQSLGREVIESINSHRLFWADDYELSTFVDEKANLFQYYDGRVPAKISDLQNSWFTLPADSSQYKTLLANTGNFPDFQNHNLTRRLIIRKLAGRQIALDHQDPETGRPAILIVDSTNHRKTWIDNYSFDQNRANLWASPGYYWLNRAGYFTVSKPCFSVFDTKKGYLTDSIQLDVYAARTNAKGELQIIYNDSTQKAFTGIIKPKDKIRVLQSAPLGDLELTGPEVVWSADGNYVIFKSRNKLMMAAFGKEAKEIFNSPDLSYEFYTGPTGLFISNYSHYYRINRYIHIWGLDLWKLSWPKVSKKMYQNEELPY